MEEKKTQKNIFSSSSTWIIILIGTIVCLVLFFLTKSTTTNITTGGYAQLSENVTCESNSVTYPIFEYDNSEGSTLRINAIFRNKKLSSLSLFYKLLYNDKKTIDISESINHAAMNVSFGKNDMNADALNAAYSKFDSGFQMSIYATDTSLNNQTLKYFMLDNGTLEDYSQEELAKTYTEKGLKCNIKK